MKSPVKRKKEERHCPINVDSLYRRWERGDKRIDWPTIDKLLNRWYDGEKIPWRKLSHTFIKPGPRPVRRRRRNQRQQTRQQGRRARDIFDEIFDNLNLEIENDGNLIY